MGETNMNVSKIVSAALKQLGVLAAGENASGEEVADAIEAFFRRWI